MTPVADLACVTDDGWEVSRLGASSPSRLRLLALARSSSSFCASRTEALLDEEDWRGFPVLKTMRSRVILGYVGRAELREALGTLAFRSRAVVARL